MNDSMQTRLLVVDDDTRLRELLARYLGHEGYEVIVAKNADDAATKLSQYSIDLMILDVMMPGKSGIEFAEEIRKERSLPILMLTALGESDDRIRGLEAGVDDYLVKPFEPRELKLRIENILGRRQKKRRGIIKFGNFSYNLDNGDLTKNGKYISLTTSEMRLITILAESLGVAVMREEISRKMHGVSERSIDVQITRLRRKIEPDPKKPIYLQTAWGNGYVLRDRP